MNAPSACIMAPHRGASRHRPSGTPPTHRRLVLALTASLLSLLLSTAAAANDTRPLCSTPHPLFSSHLNLFNGTLPLSRTLVPFPPSSFLDRCPNLNPALGSCCDSASINFTRSFIARFITERHVLTTAFARLTTRSLYTALTNRTLPPHANLSNGQEAALGKVLSYVQGWANASTSCVDHWMAYISSMICLACDPHHSHIVADPFPLLPPRLTLQQSTCSSISAHCAPVLTSFFLQLTPLLQSLVAFVRLTPEYGIGNESSEWQSYEVWLNRVISEMEEELNIDVCRYQQGPRAPTDCHHFVCTGSQPWRPSFDNSPHAFRGVNYAFSLLTLDHLVNVNAYFAYVLCMMRMAFDAQEPYNSEAVLANGCPRAANALHLLFPHLPLTSPITTWDFSYFFHSEPRESSDCRWEYASATFSWPPPHSPLDDSCSMRGYASTVWVNTTSASAAWPAYEVGCAMNLSKVICEVGDAPVPLPPEEVTWVLRVGFVVLVVGGLVLIAVMVLGLSVRYRGLREQRSRQQLRESLSADQAYSAYWTGWTHSSRQEDSAAFHSLDHLDSLK